MEQDRWNRVAEIFWGALERQSGERAAFVWATTGDANVGAEVIAMLAAHDSRDGLRVERRFVSDDSERSGGGLAPGSMVGAFRIHSLIGRGGMSEVYRAERADGEFEQVVAIKLLRPDIASADLARRFRIERALLARMAHPHIASILDGGTAPDGRPYLVLRFIDGERITAYAARLTIRARLHLFVKVAEAVQFAHNHLVVHRDIKPSNVLVGADGEPVLVDFGIAKLLDDSADAELTRTGRGLLTPSHASPEQVCGSPITTATDVYGLGVLLFELLSGQRLFANAASASDLERSILEVPAPPPSAVAADAVIRRALRGDLDRIVQMALRKEPERRYAGASELARDVERYLANRPVAAQPDRWIYRSRRFIRRNRALVAASTVLLLAGAAFAGRELSQSRIIAGERDRALREQAAGEDVLAFMTELFQQSDPRVVPGGDTLRVSAFLARAEERATTLTDQPERQMRVYRVLGDVRSSRGDFAVAESLLSLARDVGTRQLGADHVEVLRTERLLGLMQERFRGPGAGRATLERAVLTLLRTVGPNHPDLAAAYAELASSVSEPDSIRVLLDSVVALRARTNPSDSATTALLLDEQAREKGVRGRFAEAVALDEAALNLIVASRPANHPEVLMVKGNLASWLSGTMQWVRAVELAEEILSVVRSQKTAGESLALAHERVAILKANLPGGLPAAEEGIRETLRIFRETVAPEHGLITSSMRNLSIVMSHQGRELEALALMDSAIARNLASGMQDAALYLRGQEVPMLIRLGRVGEALSSARAASESRARLPRGSTYRADLTYWLGLASLAAGRADEAARYLGEAHEDIVDNFAPGHPRAAMATCALGIALARAGRVGEAKTHLRDACRRLEGWGLADPTILKWSRRLTIDD